MQQGVMHSKNSIRTLGLGLVVPLVILTGCGDDEEPGSAAEPLPKEEFIAEADRLCAETGERFDAVIGTAPPPREFTAPDPPQSVLEEVGRAGAELAEIEAEFVDQLRSLTPPDDFAPRWDSALDALARRADAAADLGEAAEAGDREVLLESLRRFMREATASDEPLRGYGFEVCGR
jgi:hypothetical protein